MNNLRERTPQDQTGPLSSDKKLLKFFVGKGRKKGIVIEKKVEKTGKPTLSTMLYYEKKKEQEERYKKIIGQRDISSFFKSHKEDKNEKPKELHQELLEQETDQQKDNS